MNLNEALNTIASERNADADELRAGLEWNAIHDAVTSDDPKMKEWFRVRFGDREPTLEELITAMAEQVSFG